LICSFYFLIFLAVCLNISTVINIKILTNSNQQTQSYKFTSHIAAFLSVVLITEMLEICIQTSYDQNVQLILKSYLPLVYGTTLNKLLIIKSKVKLPQWLTTVVNSDYPAVWDLWFTGSLEGLRSWTCTCTCKKYPSRDLLSLYTLLGTCKKASTSM
jgi:hypothetical protein